MALFHECMPWCAHIVLDTADIVRDGDFATIEPPNCDLPQASGMVTRMDDSTDSDLTASITPDVMAALRRSNFFEELDDLLSPTDGSGLPAAQCNGDFKLSESILRVGGYDSEAVADILVVLRSQGGCCDCEILYNVAETSRLKAKYWQKQAHDLNRPSGQ